MKILVVFSLFVVSSTSARSFEAHDDGRYHPELYETKFDDGRYHPGKYGGNLKVAAGVRRSSNRAPAKVLRAPVPVPIKVVKQAEPLSIPFVGIREEARQLNDNSYFYRFLSDNDIEVSQSGQLVQTGDRETPVLHVKGFYEYVGDDGQRYRVDYIADENGFQPTAEHLPTPPPVPEEILRSLAKLQ